MNAHSVNLGILGFAWLGADLRRSLDPHDNDLVFNNSGVIGVKRIKTRSVITAVSTQLALGSCDSTSSSSGKRPTACFEKIISPSTTTSKMPPLPLTSSDSTPVCSLILSARPAAAGR